MTTYVMEAKDHLDPNPIYGSDIIGYRQVNAGFAYDPTRRVILYSVDTNFFNATLTNSTGHAWTTGNGTIVLAGGTYAAGIRTHMIGERSIDTETITFHDSQSASVLVPNGVAGSNGTYYTAVDAGLTLSIPLMIDYRSGNVWMHSFSGGTSSCLLYLFRRSASFAQEILPLQDISGNGSHFEPIGSTTNWFMVEMTGLAQYMTGTPIGITAAETSAFFKLPYYWFTLPVADVTVLQRRYVIDKNDNVWMFASATSGTRNYALYKMAQPSSAIPNNAGTVGGGWTTVTPWAGTTGPNTSVTSYTTADNGGSLNFDNIAYYLPATDDLVLISKLWAAATGPGVTDPTLTRFDCTYVHAGTLAFDYHKKFVAGYMKGSTAATWQVATGAADANWVVIGVREVDLALGQNSDVLAGRDYTKRWFFFTVQPVVGGVWTPDSTKNFTILVQYQFVYGSPPSVLQVIPETGWDSAYTAYATTIGNANVVENSLGPSTASFSNLYIDSGIFDEATSSWWWSGLGPDTTDYPKTTFYKFDPLYASRGDTTPPFLKLSLQTPVPIGARRTMVRSRIGHPSRKPLVWPVLAAPTASATPGSISVSVSSPNGTLVSGGPVTAAGAGGTPPYSWGWAKLSGAFTLSSSGAQASVSQTLGPATTSTGTIRATLTDSTSPTPLTAIVDVAVSLANTFSPSPPPPPPPTPPPSGNFTIRGTQRKTLDLTTMLASVPTGNMVSVTLTHVGLTPIALNVWQYPDHAPGFTYLYSKRELASYLTLTTSGATDGTGLATLTCVYNSGAGETGSPVTYSLSIDISSPAILTADFGANTMPRCGGQLLSSFGNGAATAISAQKDKNGNVVNDWEVFFGRLVGRSTNAADANHFGTTRAADAATMISRSPYAITFDNGQTVTVSVVSGRWDVAPQSAGQVAAIGYSAADQFVNTTYNQSFTFGDVVQFEDGQYGDPANNLYTNHGVFPSGMTSANAPAPPTGYNVCNQDQTWGVTFKSRNPWGATLCGYTYGANVGGLDGVVNTDAAGYFGFRFTNLRGIGVTGQGQGWMDFVAVNASPNTNRRYGMVMIDHCYADKTSKITAPNSGQNLTPSFYGDSSSGSPGGRYNIFIHDNWDIGSTIGIYVSGSDCEIVGNRIERASEDSIRVAMWDKNGHSKCWWNFIPLKWWGDTGHPDILQFFPNGTNNGDAALEAAYPPSATPSNPATFTSTVPYASIVGNIASPDSAFNHALGSVINSEQGPGTVPSNTTDYQLYDGEGMLGGGEEPGRYYTYLVAGNAFVNNMTNGYYVYGQSSASRFDSNTLVQDWYWPTISPARDPFLTSGPSYRLQDAANGGIIRNSVVSGMNSTSWADPRTGTGTAPTNSNVNASSYDATSSQAVFNDPLHNWSAVSRLQDVIDALTTKGAEAGRGAFRDKTKVDHRNRTFDTTLLS